jgi:TPR repeat protein
VNTKLKECNFGLVIHVDELIMLLNKVEEKIKNKEQIILNYLKNYDVIPQDIYDWLLNNQNYSNSFILLGDFNYLGIRTIKIDKRKAIELYEKVADLDNAAGINRLGYFYQRGKKKFESYQRAADLGNVFGMNNLEHCYEFGIGIDINKQNAFECYQKSADLGHIHGIYNLGDYYFYRIGTNINEQKAFNFF